MFFVTLNDIRDLAALGLTALLTDLAGFDLAAFALGLRLDFDFLEFLSSSTLRGKGNMTTLEAPAFLFRDLNWADEALTGLAEAAVVSMAGFISKSLNAGRGGTPAESPCD